MVGKLVGTCAARGITFADLTDAEWSEAHPLFAASKPPLTALESVSARNVPGGTAPNRVADAINASQGLLDETRTWLNIRTDETRRRDVAG